TNKKVIVFFRHLHARSLPGQVNFLLAKVITIIEKQYPWIYKKNFFVTESYTSIEDLIKLGIKRENIFKIPPGVDHELFYPGKKTDSVQMVYFGGLRKYKRPELAIKVYEMLKDDINGLKLLIVGNGPMLEYLKNEVKDKNYNIIFTGRISDEELAKILRESWVNLHFSVTEGWGLSIMESSASGTPTVALRAPGVVETIKDGYNGYLVENLEDFKEKILFITKNIDKFSFNARNFAEDFSWDKTADLWVKFLNNQIMKKE
ncbi:MAG: glycosyltransferase family 4 protein, partial [Thermoplasmata archaeon]